MVVKYRQIVQTVVAFLFLLLIIYSAYKILIPFIIDISKLIHYIKIFLFLGICVLVFYFLFKITQKKYSILLLFPLIIIISGKGLGLLSVIIFSTASIGLGLFIYSKISSSRLSLENISFSSFIGVALNSYLIWIAMHFQINYQWIYYIFFIFEIFIFYKNLGNFLKYFYEIKDKDISWGQLVILLSGLILLLYALVPSYLWDDIVRHLYVPKQVSLFGKFDFNPNYVLALDTAIIPQSTYTALFIMGGEYAVRIINFLLVYISFLVVENYVRNRYNPRIGLFSSFFMVSTPFITWIIGIVFIDSFNMIASAIILVLTLKIFEHNEDKKNVIIFFIFAAIAYLYKQLSIYIIIPCGIVITYVYIKRLINKKEYDLMGYIGVGLCGFIFILLPIFIHNYIISKNPFFFLYNGIFQSQYYPPINFIDGRWLHIFNWRSIYDITFHGSKYMENMDFSFGISFFVLIIFLPLLLIFQNNKKNLKDLYFILLVLAGFIFLWFNLGGPYIRYFAGGIFVLSLLLALIIEKIIYISENKHIRLIIYSLFSLMIFINLICQWSIINITFPYPIKEAFTGNYKGSTLHFYQEAKSVFNYALLKYGKNSKALLYECPNFYLCDFKVDSVYWYHYNNHKELTSITNIKILLKKLFIEKKYNFIIMPKDLNKLISCTNYKDYLIEEYSAGEIGLYVPKSINVEKSIISEAFTRPIIVSEPKPKIIELPSIESTYKIELLLERLDNKETQGRFQINWNDSNGKFIGTSLIPFKLNPGKQKYVSPNIKNIYQDSVKGYLYLTSHDSIPVKIYYYNLISISKEFVAIK